MPNEALSAAAPSRQQQLATIHAQALAMASQLESFAAGEPIVARYDSSHRPSNGLLLSRF